MAVLPVEWAAKWNDDELVTGATTTKAALASLADSTDTASAEMKASLASVGTTADTELGTTVPTAADKAAVGLTTKASKFKAVGSELGTELAQGVGAGIDPATSAVNVGSSLSGLLAATATSGVGIAAAVGLGLGVALVKNMVEGAKERSEAFVKQVDSTMAEVEVNVRQSAARIKQNIFDAFTIEEAIEELKALGLEFTDVRNLTEGLNVPFTEVVEIIRGDINPANRDTLKILQEQAGVRTEINGLYANGRSVASDEAKIAQDLLGLSKDRVSSNKEAYGWEKLTQEAMGRQEYLAKQTGKELGDNVALASDLAYQMALAADAAERIGLAVGNAARNIALALDLGQ
jgi:hypothetical protein